jgi:hypothetical protein
MFSLNFPRIRRAIVVSPTSHRSISAPKNACVPFSTKADYAHLRVSALASRGSRAGQMPSRSRPIGYIEYESVDRDHTPPPKPRAARDLLRHRHDHLFVELLDRHRSESLPRLRDRRFSRHPDLVRPDPLRSLEQPPKHFPTSHSDEQPQCDDVVRHHRCRQQPLALPLSPRGRQYRLHRLERKCIGQDSNLRLRDLEPPSRHSHHFRSINDRLLKAIDLSPLDPPRTPRTASRR